MQRSNDGVIERREPGAHPVAPPVKPKGRLETDSEVIGDKDPDEGMGPGEVSTMTAIIRLADEGDAEQIQAIYGPVVSRTATSFELEAPTATEIGQRIAYTLHRFPWLVCDRAGAVLGYAYASRHRSRAAYQWSVDISVYVQENQRRKGIGRALYRSLFEILRMQGYFSAYAGIALPNPGSVGLHESVGFKPVGVYHEVGYKLGAWHDVGWWEIQLQPRVTPPGAPKDLPDAQRSPGWRSALAAGEALLGT